MTGQPITTVADAMVRTGALRHGPGGGEYRILISPGQTGDLYFGMVATEPPGGGPPLHLHIRHEELFVVLEGEFTFWIDHRVIQRTAGGTAFVPHGVPHCFKNCSDCTAHMLALFTPGDIEGFFDYGRPLADGSVPSDEILIERIAQLGPAYGLKLLGPSPLCS